MPSHAELDVEVVCALPQRQWCVPLSLPAGATVADALAASGLAQEPGVPELSHCAVGVWGEVVERGRRLRSGDRVEIYRALITDPREARRRAAESGRTLGRKGRSKGRGKGRGVDAGEGGG